MVYSLLKNFASYWEERHRPIIIYNIFFVFLWTGITLAFFHRLGNTAWLTEFTKSIFKGSTIASSQIFIILTDMSSWPWALFISKDLIVFRISLPEIVIDSREEAVTIYQERFIRKQWATNNRRTLQAKKPIKIVSFFFKIRNVFIAF